MRPWRGQATWVALWVWSLARGADAPPSRDNKMEAGARERINGGAAVAAGATCWVMRTTRDTHGRAGKEKDLTGCCCCCCCV
jgi:hypothetical protein